MSIIQNDIFDCIIVIYHHPKDYLTEEQDQSWTHQKPLLITNQCEQFVDESCRMTS